MSPDEQAEVNYVGRLSGRKVRAVFQREIPDTVGINWAGWVTGAAIASSIWLTSLLILS